MNEFKKLLVSVFILIITLNWAILNYKIYTLQSEINEARTLLAKQHDTMDNLFQSVLILTNNAEQHTSLIHTQAECLDSITSFLKKINPL